MSFGNQIVLILLIAYMTHVVVDADTKNVQAVCELTHSHDTCFNALNR